MILKKLIFNSFYFEVGLVILKELIFNCSNFGWVGVVVLDELFFNIYYLGRVWWS